ncbi:MAG: hypothetical protein JWO03_4001 [Bacteroidetes bacterium]|nr:hypothetical protein [Bacteroidota bacterium]
MATFRTLCFLLLSSTLLSGCYVAKGTKAMDMFTNCPPVFTPVVRNATYSTQIDFYKKHISGLLLFKATGDTTERVVFMTETGFKFFDFEFTPHHFEVKYIIPSLNKKIIVNTLHRDLAYIAMPPRENSAHEQPKSETNTIFKFPHGKSYDYYYTDKKCNALQTIESGTDTKKNLIIDLSGSLKHSPETIKITHQNLKLTIFLRQINTL